ncbi:MAG: cupin domain-containing protein [Alphaproteobacteria bacterium]|nr:cupin domain-containing protein [Alphaproteobacteria bacterium]
MPDTGDLADRFGVPVNREAVAKDWAERGYDCRSFTDPPRQEWNGFVHSTNELITVVEGRLKLLMEGKSLILDPGDEAFIPRHMRHSVHNIHDSTTHWLFGYD